MEREDETEPGEKLTKQERQGSFLRAGGAGESCGKRGQRRRQRDEPTGKGKDQGGGSPHHLSRRPQPLFHPPRRHRKKREAGRGSRAGQSLWVTLETRAREPGAGWGATTGGRQEDPQQVRACGGVGRGAEAGEGPLHELGEGEQKLREQPTEA